MECKIRKYTSNDYEYLYNICRETAGPSFKEDPKKFELVTVMFLDYFTTYKPEFISVAVDEKDHPIGYILCANDYKHYVKTMKEVYYPIIRKVDKSQISFFNTYLLSLWLMKKHFTHLHIDILENYQHIGLGRKLVESLKNTLLEHNEHSLSVCAVSVGTPGYYFYSKIGFKPLFKIGNKYVTFNMEF